MTLPNTLEALMAMGKDLLIPCVQLYCEAFGVSHWAITARWVDSIDGAVGSCSPDPVYSTALIEIVWPPLGDVEETIAHEVAHCYTAELALLAGAEPGTWARAAWERVAEQTARGAVALRRRGARLSGVVSRLKAARAVALTRRDMDPKVLAELALEGGQLLGDESIPEVAKAYITKVVTALAGGSTEEPTVPPDGTEAEIAMSTDGEKPPEVPGYMRQVMAELVGLKATVERLSPAGALAQAAATANPTEIAQRQLLTRTILAANRGVLSPETERDLVARGDSDGAERMLNEVRRTMAVAGRAPGSGAQQPRNETRLPALTDAQKRAANKFGVAPERYAAVALQRAERTAALNGRKA